MLFSNDAVVARWFTSNIKLGTTSSFMIFSDKNYASLACFRKVMPKKSYGSSFSETQFIFIKPHFTVQLEVRVKHFFTRRLSVFRTSAEKRHLQNNNFEFTCYSGAYGPAADARWDLCLSSDSCRQSISGRMHTLQSSLQP